jgi:RimJ/RimL family protein N-acetyltransferase
VDIGFALLPAFRGHGYAHEAATATLDCGRSTLGLERIVAIVAPDNEDSVRLLQRLGLRFEGMVTPPGATSAIHLYATPGTAT